MKVEAGRPQKSYQIQLVDVETGDVLYQGASYAGIFCAVEQIIHFGEPMEGVHQIAGWGHPMAQFYAVDQFRKWFLENSDALIDTYAAHGAIGGEIEKLKKLFRGEKL